VTTNAIPKDQRKYVQANIPYLDPVRPAGAPPFFYVGNEPRPSFGNYDFCFDDTPTRDPRNYPDLHEQIHWDAELFFVGVSPASGSYTEITRITYGFTVNQDGTMTWKDISIVTVLSD
jgi:hypothetical protein